MKFKKISDLSFLSHEHKNLLVDYIIYENGIVFNVETGKNVSRTLHGTRGYVSNLSYNSGHKKMRRQIVITHAMADLFIRPIENGEKISAIDGNKKNTKISNIEYIKTKTSAKKNKCEEVKKKKGITSDGRICTKCKKFKKWIDFTSGSICKKCSSETGINYQKLVGYSKKSVSFKTYHKRLLSDNPINVNGIFCFICSECKKIIIPTRSKVTNRIRSIALGYKPVAIICEKCKTKKKLEKKNEKK